MDDTSYLDTSDSGICCTPDSTWGDKEQDDTPLPVYKIGVGGVGGWRWLFGGRGGGVWCGWVEVCGVGRWRCVVWVGGCVWCGWVEVCGVGGWRWVVWVGGGGWCGWVEMGGVGGVGEYVPQRGLHMTR